MMAVFRLKRNDSSDFGFVTSCCVGAIVITSELKYLIYRGIEIENIDDISRFFFKILDINDKSDFYHEIRDSVGFWPGWSDEYDKLEALTGIGYKRFASYESDAASREIALAALVGNPQIEERFRKTFPFIDF